MAFRIEGFIGDDEATAAALAAYLAANPSGAEIVVNSVGGDAFEGAAMLAELERHGRATVTIRGIAASAASLLVMGGREIVMARDSVLMIHDPGAMTFGTAADHRASADTLDRIATVYAEAYARASGNTAARVRSWMLAETWMNAEEALALNFVDRIEGGESAPAPVAAFDFTRFKNAPSRLVRMAQKNGWATVSPEPKEKISNA